MRLRVRHASLILWTTSSRQLNDLFPPPPFSSADDFIGLNSPLMTTEPPATPPQPKKPSRKKTYPLPPAISSS